MKQAVQLKILVPPDVKTWLEREAAQNLRSQGAEIIKCLREKMTATGVQFGDHAPAAKTARKDHPEAPNHAAE